MTIINATAGTWSWEQTNYDVINGRIEDLTARLIEMQERLRVAEIRAADYERYSEALEQQIITKEQAYRDLQDRHDRARSLVYRLIDELAATKSAE